MLGAGCRVPGVCDDEMKRKMYLDHENRKSLSLSIVFMLRELGAGCRVPGAGLGGGYDDEMKRKIY